MAEWETSQLSSSSRDTERQEERDVHTLRTPIQTVNLSYSSTSSNASPVQTPKTKALLLGHWYEIMALYYVKSILTEISASRQDRRVLQKSKIIRIKFLSIWGMLQTSGYVYKSRNLEKKNDFNRN